jgi:sterol desaturase/sphingolipid hydroxylase (fatty acid hydroxylase superfamily)
MHITLHDYIEIISKISSRYFLMAGIAWLLFYVILKRSILYRKIQQRMPRNADLLREIGFSALTIGIFALVPLFLIRSPLIRPHTTFYTNIEQHGKPYFWLAFLFMFFLHDFYFYLTHRLMHHPALFRWFHLVHHKSVNPSPWAAYAFHPLEAIVEVGIVVVFLFTIPIHKYHLPFFFLFMIAYNVYGHLGWELYPKGFNHHWLGRWVNTSINHNMHHQYFKGNYGLYTLIWDRLFGTLRPDYDERYNEVKNRARQTETLPAAKV